MNKQVVNEHENIIKFILIILIGIAVLSGMTSCTSISGHKLEEKREQARLDSLGQVKDWVYTVRLKNGALVKCVDNAKIDRSIGDSLCYDACQWRNPVDNGGNWEDMEYPSCVGDSTNLECWQFKIGIVVKKDLE